MSRSHYFTTMEDTSAPVPTPDEPPIQILPNDWSWNLIEQLHIVKCLQDTKARIETRTCCFSHLFTLHGKDDESNTAYFVERLSDPLPWPGQEEPLTHLLFQVEPTQEDVDAAPLDFDEYVAFFNDRCRDAGVEPVLEDALRKSITERRSKVSGLYEFMGQRSPNAASYAVFYAETYIAVLELPDAVADDGEESLIRYPLANKFITGTSSPTVGVVALHKWVKYDYP